MTRQPTNRSSKGVIRASLKNTTVVYSSMAVAKQKNTSTINTENGKDETEERMTKLNAIIGIKESKSEVEKWVFPSFFNAIKGDLDLYYRRLHESKKIKQKVTVGILEEEIKRIKRLNPPSLRYFIGFTDQGVGPHLFDTKPSSNNWKRRAHVLGDPVKVSTYYAHLSASEKTEKDLILVYKNDPLCLNEGPGLSNTSGIIYVLAYDYYGCMNFKEQHTFLETTLTKFEEDICSLKLELSKQAKEVGNIAAKLGSSYTYKENDNNDYEKASQSFLEKRKQTCKQIEENEREINQIKVFLESKRKAKKIDKKTFIKHCRTRTF